VNVAARLWTALIDSVVNLRHSQRRIKPRAVFELWFPFRIRSPLFIPLGQLAPFTDVCLVPVCVSTKFNSVYTVRLSIHLSSSFYFCLPLCPMKQSCWVDCQEYDVCVQQFSLLLLIMSATDLSHFKRRLAISSVISCWLI